MSVGEAEKILEEAVARVSEHFDSVLILATRRDKDECLFVKRGAGNVFCWYGMADSYMREQSAKVNAHFLGQVIDRPDDGEAWKP
jgi:hypothetical protein